MAFQIGTVDIYLPENPPGGWGDGSNLIRIGQLADDTSEQVVVRTVGAVHLGVPIRVGGSTLRLQLGGNGAGMVTDGTAGADAADAAAIAITHIIRSSLHTRIYKNHPQDSQQTTKMTANQKRLAELQKNMALGNTQRTNRAQTTNLQDWLNHRPKQEK